MTEPKPSLINEPVLSQADKTRAALQNISSQAQPQPERVTTQPTRCTTNIYSVGLQGKF
jgi:hypothetical protein